MKYFLPYQRKWLRDKAPIKIWEKSRRIGATYVQSYEDVRDCAAGTVSAVWFSSADESAAREYIEYAAQWTRLLHVTAEHLGQVVLDSERDIKAFVIKFANGARIHALSSNPKAFRSKGGKVVLDEFAHHDDQRKMWAAARPVITWGYPLRILSTHNGTSCLYYQFIQKVKKGALPWSLHVTDIFTAVKQGLVDKIYGRPTTREEREAWIQEQHDNCFDENTWLQEYCCVAVDEAAAFLTYDLIGACEHDNPFLPPDQIRGDLFLGMDIGRKKDLSVIWGLERLGDIKYTRFVKILEKTPFPTQREILFEYLRHPRLYRACIDATGLGMQLAEEAQLEFGRYRVEAVTFSNKVKEELAYHLRNNFEDRRVVIPADFQVREDLHSVRKITTAAGNIRFDVTAAADSHADRFWALALALHAAGPSTGPVIVSSGRKRTAYQLLKDF